MREIILTKIDDSFQIFWVLVLQMTFSYSIRFRKNCHRRGNLI
jgi:hypothetical protein